LATAVGFWSAALRVSTYVEEHLFLDDQQKRTRDVFKGVINFGANNGATLLAAITAADSGSENCVIEECVVEQPHASNNVPFALFRFADSSALPHRFCVVRNCRGLGAADALTPPQVNDYYRGIYPGNGLGTIVEENRILNCGIGVACAGTGGFASDLVIWNNSLRNVWLGISWNTLSSGVVGRMIVTDNLIDLAATRVTSPVTDRTGVLLEGAAANAYQQVIVRRNQVSDIQEPASTPIMRGIQLNRCAEAIVEDSLLLDIADADGVRYANCGTVKAFNNQTATGQLRRAYDPATTRYQQELQDFAEDTLLPI
jgi:hypothetical protein